MVDNLVEGILLAAGSPAVEEAHRIHRRRGTAALGSQTCSERGELGISR